MQHKAGFINILGKPNAGKSTLLNALLGEKLAIMSRRAQTTRHRILGIINDDHHQLVFSDTPGVIDPAYKLQEKMMHVVEESLTDGDIYILVADAFSQKGLESTLEFQESFSKRLLELDVPLFLFLNKTEALSNEEKALRVQAAALRFPKAQVLCGSALHNQGLETLLCQIKDALPEHPPYYEKDQFTDKNLRFIASEYIREQLLNQYRQEVPYHCEVVIVEYKEAPDIDRIRAEIHVGRESQKGILIGKGGLALKNTGTEARKNLEKFLGKKVYLEIQVKVKPNWREDEQSLKRLGY